MGHLGGRLADTTGNGGGETVDILGRFIDAVSEDEAGHASRRQIFGDLAAFCIEGQGEEGAAGGNDHGGSISRAGGGQHWIKRRLGDIACRDPALHGLPLRRLR